MKKIYENETDLYLAIKSEVFGLMQSCLDKATCEYFIKKFGTGERFLKSICLLPLWFNESFDKKVDLKKYYFPLGCANLKAWIAYTIYDYIRDFKITGKKMVHTLSLANIFARESFIYLNNFHSEISTLFNTIDSEYLKKYTVDISIEDLHKKSIAIVSIPIIILSLRNNKKYITADIDFVKKAFKAYITARQLSDDLDDTDIDIKKGLNNPLICLMKQGKSATEVRIIARKEIEKNLILTKKYLCKINSFKEKLFSEKYIVQC